MLSWRSRGHAGAALRHRGIGCHAVLPGFLETEGFPQHSVLRSRSLRRFLTDTDAVARAIVERCRAQPRRGDRAVVPLPARLARACSLPDAHLAARGSVHVPPRRAARLRRPRGDLSPRPEGDAGSEPARVPRVCRCVHRTMRRRVGSPTLGGWANHRSLLPDGFFHVLHAAGFPSGRSTSTTRIATASWHFLTGPPPRIESPSTPGV